MNSELVLEATRASLAGSLPFPDIVRNLIGAGVQGYFAFLRGQRVTYLGRQGEHHIEWFPGAEPKGS